MPSSKKGSRKRGRPLGSKNKSPSQRSRSRNNSTTRRSSGRKLSPRETVRNAAMNMRKGRLSSFGYSNIKSLSAQERHDALDKAIQDENPLSVFRKINLIYVLNKNNQPVADILNRDKNWIRRNYM